MNNLEQQFTAALHQRCGKIQAAGISMARLNQQAEKHGGIRAVQDYLRHGGMDLQRLTAAGVLAQAVEALVVMPEYGVLFTDEEVNACFTALCDAGYYTNQMGFGL